MLPSVPKEVLSTLASPVESPDEAREIVMQLRKAWGSLSNCIGLAAPQIGIPKAVAVILDATTGISINLVNPRVVEKSDPFIHTNEGCMSSPGRRWDVERFKTIRIENYSPWPNEEALPTPLPDLWAMKGGILVLQEMVFCYDQPVERYGGIITLAVQHEIDHLNGICLPWKDGVKEVIEDNSINRGGDYFIPPKTDGVGRNAPCPCGSGKKYKKCCLVK